MPRDFPDVRRSQMPRDTAGEAELAGRLDEPAAVAGTEPEGAPVGEDGVSLRALIRRAEDVIAHPTPAQDRALGRLRELDAHLRGGVLRVAVLGQFKRGKSSLLNAILGLPLLPTGVTPITAIPTFVRGADAACLRIGFEGSDAPLILSDAGQFPEILARYVSEERNPRNEAKVSFVEIDAPTEAALRHVVLVDTPGVGSTLIHNTRAAEAVLSECDVGVFVVSADPPITAVEVEYLAQIRRHLPKIVFVLNKVDRLDEEERVAAQRYLARTLQDYLGGRDPPRILAVSARCALAAKQRDDREGVAASGLAQLEKTLSQELLQEKTSILVATARSRATALFGELLFQAEFRYRTLLTPTQELEAKIAAFEQSVRQFKVEGDTLSDLLAGDRRRMLSEIDDITNAVWAEAHSKFGEEVGSGPADRNEESALRAEIARSMASYFEVAFKTRIQQARQALIDNLASRQTNAAALIARVRETAAGLMAITAAAAPPEDAFAHWQEPYWVAPTPANAIADSTALAITRLLPRALRRKRLCRSVMADVDRATLRNVANLNWALRQNVEEAYRKFASASAGRLAKAVEETLEAMRAAVRARTERAAEIGADLACEERAVNTLRELVDAAGRVAAF